MRAGRLNKRISIITASGTVSEFGDPVEGWTVLKARLWARVEPVGGDERDTSSQMVAQQQNFFHIRYSDLVANLDPTARIVYPALAEGSPAPAVLGSNVFQISSIDEIGNREGLRIRAYARSDFSVA